MNIYKEGLERYPKAIIFWGNFLIILWILLGTIACRFFCPLIALIYLLFAVAMIGFVLRKLLCTNCYYYKRRCSLGWGKLSALFFKGGSIEKFNAGYGQKLASLTYGLLTVIPVIFMGISISQEFVIFKAIILILLLVVSIYSGVINRKKTCLKCKMRLICPGCAVKQS